MLCRKTSIIFQSNEPCTYAFCTFWGFGITPKHPSGRHASVGTTQQSERLALRELYTCDNNDNNGKQNMVTIQWFKLLARPGE